MNYSQYMNNTEGYVMREVKLHWNDGKRPKQMGAMLVKQRSLCGREFILGGFAHWKRKVTCKHCASILAGYKGGSK